MLDYFFNFFFKNYKQSSKRYRNILHKIKKMEEKIEKNYNYNFIMIY